MPPPRGPVPPVVRSQRARHNTPPLPGSADIVSLEPGAKAPPRAVSSRRSGPAGKRPPHAGGDGQAAPQLARAAREKARGRRGEWAATARRHVTSHDFTLEARGLQRGSHSAVPGEAARSRPAPPRPAPPSRPRAPSRKGRISLLHLPSAAPWHAAWALSRDQERAA